MIKSGFIELFFSFAWLGNSAVTTIDLHDTSYIVI